MHLLQGFRHVCIELDPFEKPVEKSVQEETRLMVKNKRVKGFFICHNDFPWVSFVPCRKTLLID